MAGNLFTDLYKVKENMYHDMSADDEVLELRNQVNLDIEIDSVPEKLHYLLFKMTNRCNSDCKYCPQAISRMKDSDKFDIPLPLVKQTIREAAELGATAVAINGGEPLVRGDVQEVITEIVDNKMVPVLMTNGLLLPQMWEQIGDLGLRYVIISFDSIIKEIYEDQRGCNFERAMAGIEAALKLKEKYKDTEVHVSSVLTRNNHEDFINLVLGNRLALVLYGNDNAVFFACQRQLYFSSLWSVLNRVICQRRYYAVYIVPVAGKAYTLFYFAVDCYSVFKSERLERRSADLYSVRNVKRSIRYIVIRAFRPR